MSIEAFTGKVLQEAKSLLLEIKSDEITTIDEAVQFLEGYFEEQQPRLTAASDEKKARMKARKNLLLENEKRNKYLGKGKSRQIKCPECNRGFLTVRKIDGLVVTDCLQCTKSVVFK